MKKMSTTLVLLALCFATGFTCSKNAPQQAETQTPAVTTTPADPQAQMAAPPTDGSTAPAATAPGTTTNGAAATGTGTTGTDATTGTTTPVGTGAPSETSQEAKKNGPTTGTAAAGTQPATGTTTK